MLSLLSRSMKHSKVSVSLTGPGGELCGYFGVLFLGKRSGPIRSERKSGDPLMQPATVRG